MVFTPLHMSAVREVLLCGYSLAVIATYKIHLMFACFCTEDYITVCLEGNESLRVRGTLFL